MVDMPHSLLVNRGSDLKIRFQTNIAFLPIVIRQSDKSLDLAHYKKGHQAFYPKFRKGKRCY